MVAMKLRRYMAGGLAAILTAGAVVVSAPAASAAEVGTLDILPNTGAPTTPIELVMSAPCPGGTNLIVKIFGAGFPEAGYNVVANSPQSSYQIDAGTGGRLVPLANTLRNYGDMQNPPVVFSGDYRLVLTCRNGLSSGGPTGTGFGDFLGKLNFPNPTTFNEVAPPPPVDNTPRNSSDSGSFRLTGKTRRAR